MIDRGRLKQQTASSPSLFSMPRRIPACGVTLGILGILRTGAPWRDLPPTDGTWSSVSGSFYRWRKQGLWERIMQTLQHQADAVGLVNGEFHCGDRSFVRAHQHATGANTKPSRNRYS